ncbi:uncharacterized protein F5891DRAFT_988137 [Suillus fuscotomentosus]|uniref:Uncharacterized protein n=1 Tax=Suillus fuscotomentosus TaxID=1912939 RepID=A0AAD4HBD0_9AGAM|nr:uncharacterized protein F5891DRAFT_988137 [Suillus fuscotomentosus]KAG1887532.1 hypothetical protein F5891DRAFT_988137 [Suillus fuscotomentosus]
MPVTRYLLPVACCLLPVACCLLPVIYMLFNIFISSQMVQFWFDLPKPFPNPKPIVDFDFNYDDVKATFSLFEDLEDASMTRLKYSDIIARSSQFTDAMPPAPCANAQHTPARCRRWEQHERRHSFSLACSACRLDSGWGVACLSKSHPPPLTQDRAAFIAKNCTILTSYFHVPPGMSASSATTEAEMSSVRVWTRKKPNRTTENGSLWSGSQFSSRTL